MSKLEAQDTAWADLANVLQCNGAAKPTSARLANNLEQERQQWQAVLDHWLLKWAREPSVLEDDGIEPASAERIQLACQGGRELRDSGGPCPQRDTPTVEC